MRLPPLRGQTRNLISMNNFLSTSRSVSDSESMNFTVHTCHNVDMTLLSISSFPLATLSLLARSTLSPTFTGAPLIFLL